MLFNAVRKFRYGLYRAPVPDNFVFRLCYRWTVLLLIVFSFIITCRLLLGDSFSCSSSGSVYHTRVRCYDAGVFISNAHFSEAEGFSPTPPEGGIFKKYLHYYPWVNLLFLIHAFNFYLPHLLWKCYEGGYLERLSFGVEKFFDKEEKHGLELCYLAKYVLVTQGKHRVYAALYITFEVFNYAVALAQTLWLVSFFDVTGVPDVLPTKLDTWLDFRLFYFPPIATCNYLTRSASGIMQRMSAECLLPLNQLYMKMFLFLHAWYIFITVLCGIVLIYRIALLAPSFRVLAFRVLAPLVDKTVLKSLCSRLTYSDWFFLTRIQKSMTDVDFGQMVDKIAIVAQCKTIDEHQMDERRSSYCDEMPKDLDSTSTSPL